jgi:hypothetical protein
LLDTISRFAQSVDVSRSKLRNGLRRISVFGGLTTNSGGGVLSQRGTFLLFARNLSAKFIVPEDYTSWNHFGIYSDLLTFEEDICAVVDDIIVFVESAGSIAELGAIVKVPDIASKLTIVLSSHHPKESFIQLGLTRYWEGQHDNAEVLFTRNEQLRQDEVDYIEAHVAQKISLQPELEGLNPAKLRHLIYLIVDFVDLIQVARPNDIVHFLSCLGIKPGKRRLDQLLFVLTHLELLTERQIMNSRCFSISTDERPSVEYGFHATSRRSTWKAHFFEETNKDPWRKMAFGIFKSPVETQEAQQNVA